MFQYSDIKYCILFHLTLVVSTGLFIPTAAIYIYQLLNLPFVFWNYLPFVGLLLGVWTMLTALCAKEKKISERIFFTLLPLPACIVSFSYAGFVLTRLLMS